MRFGSRRREACNLMGHQINRSASARHPVLDARFERANNPAGSTQLGSLTHDDAGRLNLARFGEFLYMRYFDLLRTLSLSSALIFALGCPGDASEEDTSETVESPSVEATPPAEASDEADDTKTPPTEKSDTDASESEEE